MEYAELNKLLEQRDKRKKQNDLQDMKRVLSSPEGRRVIWRVLAEAGVYQDYDGPGLERFMGRRSIGLYISKEIPSQIFEQMRREYESDLKAEESERQKLREKVNE